MTREQPRAANDDSHRNFEFDPKLLGEAAPSDEVREREWFLVFSYFQPRLQAHFARLMPSELDLDDLLAQIWRAALRKLADLRSHHAAWNYLVRTGHRRMIDQWRAKGRRKRVTESYAILALIEEEEIIAQSTGGAPSGAWEAKVDEISDRLATLSPEEMHLIELRHTEALRHDEIATQLGITRDAVRKRYSRVLARLRGETS